MINTQKLAALHKHWCIADAVRVVVNTPMPEEETKAIKMFGQEFALLGKYASTAARMSVWYALLYVVIEGYRDLRQSYEPLDSVLAKEDYADLLRLFRNATFHYQEDPLSEKLIGFLDKADSEDWILEVNKRLEEFFRSVLPIDETIGRFAQGGA